MNRHKTIQLLWRVQRKSFRRTENRIDITNWEVASNIKWFIVYLLLYDPVVPKHVHKQIPKIKIKVEIKSGFCDKNVSAKKNYKKYFQL